MKDAFFETTPPWGFAFAGAGSTASPAQREDAAFLAEVARATRARAPR